MKIKQLVLCVGFSVISFLPLTSQAQYAETIRTGRPGQAIGPNTTGKKVFQVQSGINRSNADIDFLSTDIEGNPVILKAKNKGFLFNNVLRYGLCEKFEISAVVDYSASKITDIPFSEISSDGISSIQFGARVNLIEDPDGVIPALGFQARFEMPFASEDYEKDKIAPKLVLIARHDLFANWSLFTNFKLSWDGFNSDPSFGYVANISFPITDKLGGFVENYGSVLNGDLTTKFDTGLGYLINNNLQIDILGGYGSNNGIEDFFVEAGVSWRMKFD